MQRKKRPKIWLEDLTDFRFGRKKRGPYENTENMGRPAKQIVEIFGEQKNLYEWSEDSRYQAKSATTLYDRYARGVRGEALLKAQLKHTSQKLQVFVDREVYDAAKAAVLHESVLLSEWIEQLIRERLNL